MLVVDATVAVSASRVDNGFQVLADAELAAPPLMWSEAMSVLHRAVFRDQLSRAEGLDALRRLEGSPVRRRAPARLRAEAWRIADELGWAKTYDAEYLALARLLRVRVITLDRRLARAAATLGLAHT